MFDQCVDSTLRFAAQFGVLVNRDVSRPANFLRLAERRCSVAPESLESLALGRGRHARAILLPAQCRATVLPYYSARTLAIDVLRGTAVANARENPWINE
jgi:hypothetical protein